MRHGRPDYNRIQDPAADEQLLHAFAAARTWLLDSNQRDESKPEEAATLLDKLTAALVSSLDGLMVSPPAHPIAADEPVFLLRASDSIAPSIVREYARIRRQRMNGSDLWEQDEKIIAQAKVMEAWAASNGSKLPDTPSGADRP